MTQNVDFHFGIADRATITCELLVERTGAGRFPADELEPGEGFKVCFCFFLGFLFFVIQAQRGADHTRRALIVKRERSQIIRLKLEEDEGPDLIADGALRADAMDAVMCVWGGLDVLVGELFRFALEDGTPDQVGVWLILIADYVFVLRLTLGRTVGVVAVYSSMMIVALGLSCSIISSMSLRLRTMNFSSLIALGMAVSRGSSPCWRLLHGFDVPAY